MLEIINTSDDLSEQKGIKRHTYTLAKKLSLLSQCTTFGFGSQLNPQRESIGLVPLLNGRGSG